jgi:hypothetical protein
MKKTISLFIVMLCITSLPLSARSTWQYHKKQTTSKMRSIPGWCSEDKSILMMNVIKENQCKNCIEIGVFAGKSLFPIAKALEYNRTGIIFAIDAWNPVEATKGYNLSDPNYNWWAELDYDYFFEITKNLIRKYRLEKYCSIVRSTSHDAVDQFLDETIDFIHFDGSYCGKVVYEDVINYLPKVKDGGYILINDPNRFTMKHVLVYLLERADLETPFSRSSTYLLFRKNKQRMKNANKLMDN